MSRPKALPVPGAYRYTTVPVGRTRDEIDRCLQRYGGDAISWQDLWTTGKGKGILLRFQVTNRVYRVALELSDDPQLQRQRMRALFNLIKSTMEQAAFGILRLEDLLLAYTEVGDGRGRATTVAEAIKGQIEQHLVPSLTAGLKALPAKAGVST